MAAKSSPPGEMLLEAVWEREFGEGRFSDTVFKVGDRDFSLSRFPLAAASPVFAAMLFSSEGIRWKEQGPGVPVVVNDCLPLAFEQLARYAYRLELQLSPSNVLHVQRAADKYQVLPLVDICDAAVDEMLEGGDANNLLLLLDAEMQICGSIGEMGKRATEGSILLRSEAFLSLSPATVEWLLVGHLEADEEEVWNGCRAWASKRAKVESGCWQDHLRPLCHLIRFPLLPHKVFDTEVVRTGLLTSEQEVSVLLHARGSVTIEHFPGPRVCLHFDRASAAPNVSICDGGTTVEFDKDGAHRCVFAVPGFEVGVHSWTITWLKPGCCGYAGVATAQEVQRGSSSQGRMDRFLYPDICAGFSNMAKLMVERSPGARLAITVDMDLQKIIFQSHNGRYEQTFEYRGKLHPSIDADENNTFSIRGGVHL